jgi:hypothetical protein
MYKKCKVVMLPTNEKAQLLLGLSSKGKLITYLDVDISNDKYNQKQHLYILSDEKPVEGDWYMYIDLQGLPLFPMNKFDEVDELDKKIIASTAILEEVDTFERLPHPSQSFIDKYVSEYNRGNIISEILVEYEEDLSYMHTIGNLLKVNSKDNTITIKKLKDSWSREEVKTLLHKAYFEGYNQTKSRQFDEFIESNL